MIASCFVITMALTGSDWNLRKTFLVLVGTRGFVATTDAESFKPSLVLVSLLGSTLVLVRVLGSRFSLYLTVCLYNVHSGNTFFLKLFFGIHKLILEVKLYLIASCFVITIAFTGSSWYLGRTFLVLVGNSGLCRIN